MNVNILCVGTIKEKYFKAAQQEYEKRLSKFAKLTLRELEEYRLPSNPSPGDIAIGLSKEASLFRNNMNKSSFSIALDIEGKELTSLQLADKIQDIALQGYGSLTFLIGSSYGMDQQLKSECDLRLSFSKMTFPHQLMRIILLEQLYRAMKIIHNEPYHK